jgi:hypothetical protein
MISELGGVAAAEDVSSADGLVSGGRDRVIYLHWDLHLKADDMTIAPFLTVPGEYHVEPQNVLILAAAASPPDSPRSRRHKRPRSTQMSGPI